MRAEVFSENTGQIVGGENVWAIVILVIVVVIFIAGFVDAWREQRKRDKEKRE